MTVLELISNYDKSWVEKADITLDTVAGVHLYYGALDEVPYNLLSKKIERWFVAGYSNKKVSFNVCVIE